MENQKTVVVELTEKKFNALQEMVEHYKEHQQELYDNPPFNMLFTQTQAELFELFDID